ncbi:MAG: glycine cleavage system aminomethyltransferase GcvT [Pyrinomonadaceae bacterium]|nr:glycine cleavage system aminomethyltransferase GcvT [Phycisphaerales bacterium]
MLRTPLYKFHVDHGAKMVEYAGWEMPMLYTPPTAGGEAGAGSIQDEHKQVRTSGGLFDVSHMGRVKMTGRHARKLLERLCSRRINDMQAGQCRYSLVCNEQGGVRDDVIVYRVDDDDFLVIVNASNRDKLLGHFEAVRASGDLTVKIDDQTKGSAMVALQGPKVMDLVAKFSKEIPSLKRYRFAVKNLLIMKLIVSRTGYTGEDGVEVILPAMAVDMAMKLLLKDVDLKSAAAVVKPAGLGARDTLRMEAAMPLYGHELGEETNALACGIDFAISLDKDQDERGEAFIGMEALKKTRDAGGPPRILTGIVIEGKRTARQGNLIKIGDKEVGIVTSACLSPTLGYPIAMGFVDRDKNAEGAKLSIDTGRNVLEGTVVKMPFYKVAK